MKLALKLPVIDLNNHERSLEIFVGDVLSTEHAEAIDLLCVSAFPDDYAPTLGTVIKALAENNVFVAQEAANKALDFRKEWQCWISQPLTAKGMLVDRLLCFEHGGQRDPASVVGNVFRAISEFILESPERSMGVVRLPLLSTGNQRADKASMLEATLRQAYLHLRQGLPVERLQLVLWPSDPETHTILLTAGRLIERIQSEWRLMNLADQVSYDYFVSYRRIDRCVAEKVIEAIKIRQPMANFFIDGQALDVGAFWKPQLISGLYASKKALCFITPTYVTSGECMDEYHAALCCNQYRQKFLKPLLCIANNQLETLPGSMQRVQLIDALCPPRSLLNVIDQIVS